MIKRTYKPIADCVVVKKLKMEDHTKGGILLPDMAQGNVKKGKVVAVGKGLPDAPMYISVGDVILYNARQELMIDDYELINQHNILVVVEEKEVDDVPDGTIMEVTNASTR